MDKRTVVERGRETLQAYKAPWVDPVALEDDVRRDNGFWYVPVKPTQPLKRTFEFQDALAEAERELDEDQYLNVLFVPLAGED